jgi:phosphoribosylglycinamide formyltransferase-1
MDRALKIAILISGRGSNMVALIENLKMHPKVKFCCVVSDNSQALGIPKAKKMQIPTCVIDGDLCSNQYVFEEKLDTYLQTHQPNLILLAGFMRLLSAKFVAKYKGKILNIHPSLLPKYPGLNTHQRALENNDKEIGATVHWVDEKMDNGEIMAQCRIKVKPQDTAQTLSQRLLPYEHQLYIDCVRKLLNQIRDTV